MAHAQTVRLLCDEMLARLAKWLRAAGHDVTITPAGCADEVLIELARSEGRALVSRDHRLSQMASGRVTAVWLPMDDLDAQAHHLGRVLALDFTADPFTRCLLDNTPLAPADEEERARIPPQSRSCGGRASKCPCCGRIYWLGGHAERMLATLRRWQQARSEHGPPPPIGSVRDNDGEAHVERHQHHRS